MQQWIFIIGAGIFGLLMLGSLFSAIVSHPGTFVIVFGLGGALIFYMFYRSEGFWNPDNENYPPKGKIVGILVVCLIISWVVGSKPTSLSDCPVAVGRWC